MLGNKQEDTDLLFCRAKINNKITSLPDQTAKVSSKNALYNFGRMVR